MSKRTAPFTDDEVDALNLYQASGVFHPFTCANGDRFDLVASNSGWKCPYCGYTQDWAHHWMVDKRFIKSHVDVMGKLRQKYGQL